MTATMTVPLTTEPVGVYYSDMVTKITYQDMVILGRAGSQYILKTSLAVAEEINHMLATGTVTFSAALRPDQDVRFVDVTQPRRDHEPHPREVRPALPGDLPGARPPRSRRSPPLAFPDPAAHAAPPPRSPPAASPAP